MQIGHPVGEIPFQDCDIASPLVMAVPIARIPARGLMVPPGTINTFESRPLQLIGFPTAELSRTALEDIITYRRAPRDDMAPIIPIIQTPN